MNVVLMVLGDLLMPAPLLAGIVGLLQPHSDLPFLVLAITASVGLFLLFFQAWTLVLHSVLSADAPQRPAPRQETSADGSAANRPAQGASADAGPA
jgi:hypothetical protein